MKSKKIQLSDIMTVFICIFCFALLIPQIAHATSDSFPPYEAAPALSTYFADSTPNNTYYIATSGNDSTGTGAIGSPWASVVGARTGGAGTPAAAGDLVYFRGGSYVGTVGNAKSHMGYYYIDTDGTASDRIVFTAYPNETPTFSVTGDEIWSIDIRGDYIVLDGLTFTTGPVVVQFGSNPVIQNCTFNGRAYKGDAGQINSSHIYLEENADNAIVRNNHFTSVRSHSIKAYASQSMPNNIIMEHNVFVGGTVSFGLITFKSEVSDYIIRYNRFQDMTTEPIVVGSSYTGEHDGLAIHHNVFDNCSSSVIQNLGTSSTGQVLNMEVYSNVVINSSSGNRVFLELDCDEGGCLSGASSSLGEFYDNAFYGVADVIDPEEASDFTNYPDFFNYNAYPSTGVRDSAANENWVASSSWGGSTVIQAYHGITRTGSSGNYFYTIEDNNAFVGAGRFGDNIGGFQWTGTTAPAPTPAPDPPSNLRIVL
jgi:hypothetical protein